MLVFEPTNTTAPPYVPAANPGNMVFLLVLKLKVHSIVVNGSLLDNVGLNGEPNCESGTVV